jgi:uncharacterized damage-inducible protein DinB
MTTETSRIVDELTRAVEGDPWHGSSVAAILADVSAGTALSRPHERVHTIWEIVRHMTAWTNEVARRLDGHSPADPQEGDWPAPKGASEDDWRRDVAAFFEANRLLLQKLERVSDSSMHVIPSQPRNRAAGAGVSSYVLLHGLAQHHAYHAGQIGIMKKMTARR